MTERLNNDQIAQRIMDANSDLKRYLNLAPGLKIAPPEPKPDRSKSLVFTALSPPSAMKP